MKLIPSLLCLSLLCSAVSYAEDKQEPAEAEAQPSSSPYEDCINTHETNREWAECGSTEVERQEALLKEAWQKASDAMKRKLSCAGCGEGEAMASFQREQDAWKAFQESACEYYIYGGFGREGAVLSYPGCKAANISARTSRLNAIADSLNDEYSN